MYKFAILDTEFTAWKGSLENNWSKDGEYKELVQISAYKVTKVHNRLEILDKIDLYILPKYNNILSEYFINLTGIKQDFLNKNGIDFINALKKFYEFCEKGQLCIYSYGYDYNIINENLELYGRVMPKQMFHMKL